MILIGLGRIYERKNIKIGLAAESEVNREFIEVWDKAEKKRLSSKKSDFTLWNHRIFSWS